MISSYADAPREVRTVLDGWIVDASKLLGDALVGARLYGSAVSGGFDPKWSDLDVCVVLDHEITREQAAALRELHRAMEARFLRTDDDDWHSTQLFDGVYAPITVLPSASRCTHLRVATGYCEVRADDPIPGFQRHALAHQSIVLCGEPGPPSPPSHPELVDGHAWLVAALSRQTESHSPVMMAGLIQETARALCFWSDRQFIDKSAALTRVRAERPSLAAACRIAQLVRSKGSVYAEARRDELQGVFTPFARASLDLLCSLLARE